MLAAKDYSGAITAFTALGDYRDSAFRLNEAREKREELRTLRVENGRRSIAAGGFHTVGLRSDGSVVAVGSNEYGQCEVSGWTHIVAIAAKNTHTVGLRSDGSVVAVGDNEYGQCKVSDWTDIRLP